MKTKPQNLQGHYAGFITRSFAFVIDLLILVVLLACVSFALSLFVLVIGVLPDVFTSLFSTSKAMLTNIYSEALPSLTYIINALLVFSYFVFFWMSSGQTVGKALMGVRVVSANGRPLTFLQASLRFFLYPVSAMFFFLGFFWVLADNQRQGWHDNLAHTYVIYTWKAIPHANFLHQWQQKWKKKSE